MRWAAELDRHYREVGFRKLEDTAEDTANQMQYSSERPDVLSLAYSDNTTWIGV